MAFEFIYGDDEYLVTQAAKSRFMELAVGLDPEFGAEIVDGSCQKVEEMETLSKRLREAIQTMGLFGGSVKAVWLKGINFISDSVVGRAEGTLNILEDLKPLLEGANPDETKILISANPVDRRLSFFKWLINKGKSREIASLEGLDAEGLNKFAKARWLSFEPEAAELFLKKVGSSARMVENELEKLSIYLNASEKTPQKVYLDVVMELTSASATGEFFEPLEAFYSRKTGWSLESTRTYFAMQKDASARPLLAAFFNRNRLLLMLRACLDEGLCKAGFKGLAWMAKAEGIKTRFGAEKTPFNIFAQNPWYLGRLVKEAERFSLKELQAIQKELVNAFEKIHSVDEELVMEGLITKFAKG